MSLLVISEILRLFVRTFTANNKSSLGNSEHFRQPIQMQLSKEQNIFFDFFAPFLKSTSNFERSKTKMTLIAYVLPKSQTSKDVVR